MSLTMPSELMIPVNRIIVYFASTIGCMFPCSAHRTVRDCLAIGCWRQPKNASNTFIRYRLGKWLVRTPVPKHSVASNQFIASRCWTPFLRVMRGWLYAQLCEPVLHHILAGRVNPAMMGFFLLTRMRRRCSTFSTCLYPVALEAVGFDTIRVDDMLLMLVCKPNGSCQSGLRCGDKDYGLRGERQLRGGDNYTW